MQTKSTQTKMVNRLLTNKNYIMKLIPMTSFVLNFKGNTAISHKAFEFARKVKNYAEFLRQHLTLGMFVPCDEDGNVLFSKPNYYSCFLDGSYVNKPQLINYENCVRYKKAEEKVLFKGFYVEFNAVKSPQGGYLDVGGLQNKTIETIIGAELQLTDSAIKLIGLNP